MGAEVFRPVEAKFPEHPSPFHAYPGSFGKLSVIQGPGNVIRERGQRGNE